MGKKVKTAIFPVGGLGTRFLPATKSMPKEMLPIVDKPLIQYAFEAAQEAGIERFIFITGRNKNIISNHFDHVYELQRVLDESRKKELLSITRDWIPPAGSIAFIRQQEPKGLGHAILCAKEFVGDEPFVVMLADEMFMSKKPFIKELVDLFEDKEESGGVLALAEVDKKETYRYGIISPGAVDNRAVEIKDMVEKPEPDEAPSCYSITGQYVFDSEIFSYLENQKKGKDGEIQLTDAMRSMSRNKAFNGLLLDGKRFDCGSKLGFLEANVAFAMEDPELKGRMKEMLKRYS